MSAHELSQGLTDEYYTPPSVFKALNCGRFNMDVAAPQNHFEAFVDAEVYVSSMGLEIDWIGFIWCNPPFGKRGSKLPWVNKVADHGNGLLLMPDRTSTDWWVRAAKECINFLTTYDKIKFVGPYGVKPVGKDGKEVNAPGTGNTIFAFGKRALEAVRTAEANGFGMTHKGVTTIVLIGCSPSWVDVIEIAVNRHNGQATVQAVYEEVERLAPDKIQGNVHWKEKIRQKLQEHFTRVDKGVYKNN